jgi:hypothetical protein
MSHLHKMVSAAAMAVAAMAPNVVPAQALSDQWQFGASVYGWLPHIRGSTTFPAGASRLDVSVDISPSQIIDHLKFAGMGTFDAQKGRWGVFTDFIYMDVGGSKSATRDLRVGGVPLPVGVTADASLDIKSAIWTLAGSYRVVADPGASLDVFAGARLLELKQRLGWQFSADVGGLAPPPRSGGSDVKANKTDAIIGVKGRYAFGTNREWFVPYYVDVGGGDSKHTWQAVGGIGYAFQWGEVFAVYRYLDYKFKNADIGDVNFGGPAFGVAFHW